MNHVSIKATFLDLFQRMDRLEETMNSILNTKVHQNWINSNTNQIANCRNNDVAVEDSVKIEANEIASHHWLEPRESFSKATSSSKEILDKQLIEPNPSVHPTINEELKSNSLSFKHSSTKFSAS